MLVKQGGCIVSGGYELIKEPWFCVLLAFLLLAVQADAADLRVTTDAAHTGAYGLEVTPSTSCTGMDIEILNGLTVTGTEFFQGCDSVIADSDFVVTGTGDATITAGRKIVFGSGFRVESGATFTAQIDASLLPVAYVQDNSPNAETAYNLEFHVNFDGIDLDGGDELEHFTAHSADGIEQIKLIVRQNASLEMVLAVLEDDGALTETVPQVLQPGWNKIVMNWTASTDATASLVVNQGAPLTLSGLNTDSRRIDFVRWGVVRGAFVRNPGFVWQDGFVSRR
jgi:hypothetical protein